MARPGRQVLALKQLVGMNTADPSISLLKDQAQIIENVDLVDAGLGLRRKGFVDAPSGGTPPSGVASNTVQALHRHVPGGDDNAAELWAVIRNVTSGVASLRRYAAGTWTTIALADAPVTTLVWSFATFNGKLFIAYDSTINRLHVWDGSSVRRVGLAPPAAAPGLANLGAGALGFTRFYRVRFRTLVSGTLLFSEPSPSNNITVAASSGVIVTRPAQVDGNEQVWVVEASNTANGPWFEISGQIPIATLVFNDTNATIPTTTPSTEVGTYQLPPSAKYLAIYQNQIIMAGAWEVTAIAGQTVPKNNRVWFTRPLGALDIADDESIPSTFQFKFWVDVGEDNDRVTGLSYPLEGIPYVTKLRQFWSLIPRDDPNAPFAVVRLTDAVGCRDHRTLAIGEDENGNPALYFNSLRGPYRMGRSNLQFVGRDIAPDAFGLRSSDVVLWYADLRQVWFATSGTNLIHKFNVRYGSADRSDIRNGWTRDRLAGTSPTIGALGMFSDGFAVSDPELQPVVGGQMLPTAGNSFLWQRSDSTSVDVSTAYRSFIRSANYTLGELLYNVKVTTPRVYVHPSPEQAIASLTLLLTVTRNYQTSAYETQETSTVTFGTTVAPNTKKYIGGFEGIQWSDAEAWEFELGDVSAVDQTWRIIAFMVPYDRAEEAI